MKIDKSSLLYKEVTKGFKVLGSETILKVANEMKENKMVCDYKVATIWRVYHFIIDNDETLKEMVKRMDLKDKHIDTMLFSILKDLNIAL